jgi:DNA (cytosine-5)-methyltransferase 1
VQQDIFEQLREPLPKIEHLKVGTFFSGIGSPEKALKRIGMDYELMFFSEIDKYAIQSYCAIHNEPIEKNKGDITKIQGKDLPYCDLWFGGFPCQDISLAGKQRGFSKDIRSRSSLGWEMIRLIDEVKEKPKYVIFENVANIMSEPMRPTLNLFKEDLENRGYTLYNEILNAKDYGIPQNRERYFLVAILGGYYFQFPQKQELKLRLKDMLEDEVDEKYYLKDYQVKALQCSTYESRNIERKVRTVDDISETLNTMNGGNREPMIYVSKIGNTNLSGNGMNGNVFDSKGLSPTLTTNKGEGLKILEATQKGYAEATDGDSINLEQPNSQTRRGRVGKQVAQTLTTSCNQGAVQNLRIRKLTPLECVRLMDFDDIDYYKMKEVGISNSQIYKCCGNSIVVNVLEAIFKELFKRS